MAIQSTIETRVQLPAELAARLSDMAKSHHISESQVIEKALDILFSLTELLDEKAARQGWSSLSEG